MERCGEMFWDVLRLKNILYLLTILLVVLLLSVQLWFLSCEKKISLISLSMWNKVNLLALHPSDGGVVVSQRETERGKSLTKFELISKLSFNESSLTELQSWRKQTDKKYPGGGGGGGGGGGLNVYKCLVYIIMSPMWQYHASSVKYEGMALQRVLKYPGHCNTT